MELANKEYLLLLLLLIPYLVWYIRFRKGTEATMTLSDTWLLKNAPKTLRQRLSWLPMACRCACLVLIVICLCRPQTHNAWDEREVEGIDIMMTMDISTSMLAEDLKPNRIEAAKNVQPYVELETLFADSCRDAHLARMKAGECDAVSGSIFLDVLMHLCRVGDMCSNIGIHTLVRHNQSDENYEHTYIANIRRGLNPDFNEKYEYLKDKYEM